MWTCPKCGEQIEDQFTSCWKCAAPLKESAPKPLFSRSARRYFLLGMLFELVLILLCFLLPECWLQVEVRNFTLITHFPLMLLMEGCGEIAILAILGLLIGLAVMASIWGFLIYLVTRLIKRILARFVVSPRQKLALKYCAGFLGTAVLLDRKSVV